MGIGFAAHLKRWDLIELDSGRLNLVFFPFSSVSFLFSLSLSVSLSLSLQLSSFSSVSAE